MSYKSIWIMETLGRSNKHIYVVSPERLVGAALWTGGDEAAGFGKGGGKAHDLRALLLIPAHSTLKLPCAVTALVQTYVRYVWGKSASPLRTYLPSFHSIFPKESNFFVGV